MGYLKDKLQKAAQDTVKSLVAQGWTPVEAQELLDIGSGKLDPSKAQTISTNGIPRKTPYITGNKALMTPKERANHSTIYHQGVQKLKEQRAKAAKGAK